MFCGTCGARIPDGSTFCPHCGARTVAASAPGPAHAAPRQAPGGAVGWAAGKINEMAGGSDQVELRFGNFFDAVFRRHSPGEADVLFSVGSPTTTPSITRVSRTWPHPWIYSRVFLVLLVAFVGLWILSSYFENPNGLPGLMFVGALLVPFSVTVFFFETNVPRNLGFARVIEIFFVGGVLSLLCIYPLDALLPGSGVGDFGPALLTGIIEELAKVAAIVVFVKRIGERNYVLTGLLVGAAVGAGFAAFETAGYIFNQGFLGGLGFTWDRMLDSMMDVTLLRAALAIGGHVVWAAAEGGALALADRGTGFSLSHLASRPFLVFLGISILLHALWDTYPLPLLDDVEIWDGVTLKYVLLIVIAWMAIAVLLHRGINEVNQLSAAALRAQREAPREPGAAPRPPRV
ncbi:PrsW family intramembrane metalloprotease [Thermophilibacter sp.]